MRGVLAVGLALPLLWTACSRKPVPATRTEFADVLRPAEEWLRLEPIRILRDYVRIDTTNETKGEKEGAEFLKSFFDCAGVQNEMVCPAPGRCNLLARLPGRRRKGALLLLNHIDVVIAYPQLWKAAPPFEGTIKAGYMYGRGVYDMKSIGIAQAMAMRRLKERGIVPESDVLFLAEADEEIGQRWGSRWLLEHRPEWFEGVANVLNEGGTDEMVLRDVRYWGIETIQAGYALAELAAPTDQPLKDLAARWSRIDAPLVEPDPDVVAGFDMLANHLPSPLTDPLRHLDRVRRNPEELASLPDRYAAFLDARIKWFGPYPYPFEKPTESGIAVVINLPPRVEPRQYLKPILDSAAEPMRVIRTAYGGPAGASPYPSPFTDLLARVTEAFSPGVQLGPLPTFGGYTTSILFRQRGFPTYGYSPIGMNITDAARRHGNDERLFLRDFVLGCAIYEEILEEFARYQLTGERHPAPIKSDNK